MLIKKLQGSGFILMGLLELALLICLAQVAHQRFLCALKVCYQGG